MASDVLQPEGDDTARVSWNLRKTITKYQETFSVIEKVRAEDGSVYHTETGPVTDLIMYLDGFENVWFSVDFPVK